MQGISKSMAGRAAVLQLLPFSLAETSKSEPVTRGIPRGARPAQGS